MDLKVKYSTHEFEYKDYFFTKINNTPPNGIALWADQEK